MIEEMNNTPRGKILNQSDFFNLPDTVEVTYYALIKKSLTPPAPLAHTYFDPTIETRKFHTIRSAEPPEDFQTVFDREYKKSSSISIDTFIETLKKIIDDFIKEYDNAFTGTERLSLIKEYERYLKFREWLNEKKLPGTSSNHDSEDISQESQNDGADLSVKGIILLYYYWAKYDSSKKISYCKQDVAKQYNKSKKNIENTLAEFLPEVTIEAINNKIKPLHTSAKKAHIEQLSFPPILDLKNKMESAA